MKKNFTLLLILIVASMTTTAQSVQWQKLLGGSNDDNFNYNIQQTTDGGYITAGQAQSSNTGTLTGVTGNGGYDGWIVKTDASGNTQWQKLLGGSGDDLLYSIQQTSDGGYIVAGYSNSSNTGTLTGLTNNGANDGWIIKLDASGNTVWQKLVGGSNNDYLFWIRQTSDGGYIMAGQSFSSNSGTLTGVTNNGSMDGWIIKLDAAGTTTQFQKLLGGTGDDFFREIEQTSDGGYITTCGANSNDGTLSGVPGFTAAGSAWVVKLDATGGTTWQKLFGGNGIDNFVSIKQTTPDGGYIAVGYSNTSNDGTLTGVVGNGGLDGWVMKLDALGNTTWQKLVGGLNDDLLIGIQQTADGGYIAAGYSLSSNSGTLSGITNHGGNDGWLIKLSSSGVVQSQSLFGGNVSDQFQGISKTLDGGFIITGNSYSSNTGTLTGVTNNGGQDGWILKLTQFTLPITLDYFSAKKINETEVELDWFTLTEQNNKGFYVERSLNNASSFSDLTFIPSQAVDGNSSQKLNYSFIDNSNDKRINYYRLKQVDRDGQFKYSSIIRIDLNSKLTVSVYPNPSKSSVHIYSDQTLVNIQVLDMAGKTIKQFLPAADNTYNVNDLKTGMYFIKLIGKSETQTIKFSKL